jgi:hypothetical protein
MNARIALSLAALGLAAMGLVSPAVAQTKGQLRLPEFAGLADKATKSVMVTLDPALLGLACRFLDKSEPDEAAAQQLCMSLTGIYVRKYTFDSDYAYPQSDIAGVRKQLSAPGWSQLVGARSKKEQTDVDVYLLIDGGQAKSLAIIASEPREFVIVNIVGSIDLEKLHELEGKFGVPELQIEADEKVPAAKTAAPKK